jgi:Family of unknown function (DUF6527)
MRCNKLTAAFIEYIPVELEPETLYISMNFETAVHLCACGCRTKVVTPFGPHDWILTFDGTVSLRPSVGNGQQACRSHYYIRNNGIDWLSSISAGATRAAGARDRAAHVQAVNPPPSKSWWRRAWSRIRQAIRRD